MPGCDTWCSRCGTAKSISEFGVNRGRKDGLTVYCIACGNAASRASRLKLRGQALEALGGKCVECGYTDLRALQFDHVNSDGNHERTSGLGAGTKFLRAIIAGKVENRVQILCANCNQIKMWESEERIGRRVYTREVPTERIDRPNRRWTPEQRARQSEKSKAVWDDPERRAAQIAAQTAGGQSPDIRAIRSRAASEKMKRRWASGEVPNRPRTE